MDETGLYNMGTRYYDPVIGQFISSDPMGHNGSLDLYSFANNDPANWTDSDGRIATGFNTGFTGGSTDSTQSWVYKVGVVAGQIDRPIADTINQPVMDFVPIVETGKMVAQSFTAHSFVGEPLTGSQRMGSVVAAGLSAIPVGVVAKADSAARKVGAKGLHGTSGSLTETGILRTAAQGKGNFGVGSASTSDAV